MEEDTKDLLYIGNLSDGIPVYDRKDSHWQTAHKTVTKELLEEALEKFDTKSAEEEGNILKQAVDMGRVVGKTFCVPITELDQTFMVRRIGRLGETRTILNRPPVDCQKITVILSKKDGYYELATTYIGEMAPREPWDQTLLEAGKENELNEAIQFWNTHALVYDSSVTDFVVLPDGTQMDKSQFEKEYIFNKSKKSFDVPDDSLLLVMGVPGSGKTFKAKGIAERFDGNLISTDDIRAELFESELKNGQREKVYEEDSKRIVYEELVNRVEESLKSGSFTIADGTFLFESGENARKQIYQLVQKYKRPLRVVVLKVPLEVAKFQNSNREKRVEDKVVEQMWNYMNNSYDSIVSELKTLPDTKYSVIESSKIVTPKNVSRDDYTL